MRRRRLRGCTRRSDGHSFRCTPRAATRPTGPRLSAGSASTRWWIPGSGTRPTSRRPNWRGPLIRRSTPSERCPRCGRETVTMVCTTPTTSTSIARPTSYRSTGRRSTGSTCAAPAAIPAAASTGCRATTRLGSSQAISVSISGGRPCTRASRCGTCELVIRSALVGHPAVAGMVEPEREIGVGRRVRPEELRTVADIAGALEDLASERKLPRLPTPEGGRDVAAGRLQGLSERERVFGRFSGPSRRMWADRERGVADQTDAADGHAVYLDIEDDLYERFAGPDHGLGDDLGQLVPCRREQ